MFSSCNQVSSWIKSVQMLWRHLGVELHSARNSTCVDRITHSDIPDRVSRATLN